MEEQKLVEKYRNIPDNEFVPLECLGDDFIGKFEINKLGHIKKVSNGIIRKQFKAKEGDYPYASFSITDDEGRIISKYKFIHRILAETFLSNPNNYPAVDHIDRNKLNYSLSNLRWVSYEENNKNKCFSGKHISYIKLGEDKKEIERFDCSDLTKSQISKISRAVNTGTKYKGFYWKHSHPNLDLYISLFGEPDNNSWKVCLRDNYYECNINGLFRVRKTGRLVIGTISRNGYWCISSGSGKNRKIYLAHRLICETFLNRLLKDHEIVDHISTDRLDNRFSNLRVCSNQGENMNNILKKKKRYIPIFMFSLNGIFMKKFNSLKEASKDLGHMINFSGKDYIITKYILCRNENIKDIIKNIIFKYNSGDLVKVFRSLRDAEKESSISRFSITKYIDTGKLAPDGHYYYHGPHEFTDDEQNKNQDSDNNI